MFANSVLNSDQMASTSTTQQAALSENQVVAIKNLLWGNDLREEVFLRWTQGFTFSKDEPSALLQLQGGPCAVIAPVQAFVVKNIIFDQKKTMAGLTASECQECLINALVEVLTQAASTDICYLITHNGLEERDADTVLNLPANSEDNQVQVNDNEVRSPKRQKLSNQWFHSNLRCQQCNSNAEVKDAIHAHISTFQGQYGVLLFLYSLVLTKGIEQIKNEVEDPGEPLIDNTHGHGSQSMINLLLCGKAVSNVFDNDKDISGMQLHGISKQCTIGFLTQLEHLRYCEVGWYLKNPCVPVWLLASETHITVLFAYERGLVTHETASQAARRIFKSFDPDGNGFITVSRLVELMDALELVSEPEYVNIMQSKMDPEGLGIILLGVFLEEFFPELDREETPEKFLVYHYNGLERSCPDKQVKYLEGTAKIADIQDIVVTTDITPILTCLQTKWPTVELHWKDNIVPSMN
ncbi:ubiquitin carboxyl-terminal hydrolase MINDY-3-like [Lineus longissimus]|uniref:ubiquitin carboxyl-terminal hydrolase MINDY-3-like n=1 Tax=Lineus longissimus TaxID=88925 RepID=UPI002B4EBA37